MHELKVAFVVLVSLGLAALLHTRLPRVVPVIAFGSQPESVIGRAELSGDQRAKIEKYVVQDSAEIVTIERHQADRVTISPLLRFGLPAEITLERAPRYTIVDAGASSSVAGWGNSVEELLAEVSIPLGQLDRVTPAKTASLTGGEAITIVRVVETEVKVKETIPYEIVSKEDPSLPRGEERIEVAGTNGRKIITFRTRRENGKEVSRSLVAQLVDLAPVNRVVVKGTKIVLLAEGTATWYRGVGPMTAAHRSLPKGKRVEVEHVGNGKRVVVVIADRGPFTKDILDLSADAFKELASLGTGRIPVRITNID